MLILAGLGNPGAKYARNRHNIGFMAVDEISRRRPGFSPEKNRFQSRVSEGRLGGTKVVCLKPQTYMNESGRAVGEAMRFYKATPADVIVFHDELDLAPGEVKVKHGGGHAGHNGLRSINAHIGPDFVRVRLGIGHPGDKARVTGHVLGDFAKSEEPVVDCMCEAVEAALDHLAARDWARFSTEVARRVQATAPNPPAG